MHITKVPSSYDDYKVECSWSELKAIENALASNHEGVVADEAFARMQFYMARIPGPGEEKGKGDDDTLEQTRAKEALKGAGEQKPKDITPDDIPMPGQGEESATGPKSSSQDSGEDADLGPDGIKLEDIPMPKRRLI